YEQVLGLENIGINHGFFELGGHSLKATILISRIHKELQAKVPLNEVFRNSTIKDLARYILSLEQNIYEAIKPVKQEEYYPTSSAQKRVYIMGQLDEAGTSYNMPGSIKVKGILDKKRLEQAFYQLVQRHESLRTTFEMVEDDVVQRVHTNIQFEVISIDGKENEIDRLKTEFVRPFDLSNGPLLRVNLLTFAEDSHIILFDMHHIISDGVSLGVLVDEFVQLYKGDHLAPLRIQYKDFSVWQNKLFTSDEIDQEEQYWLNLFAEEVPVLNMPTDYARPSVQSFEGDNIEFKIDKRLTHHLNELATNTGSTLY
ncbi:condensation domain-containing protein, partial [Streptomyces sp. NPDC057052]|uniref:condensation domain-containing protein n=1 Tax=Streptomyces sp. NPDC057052 TaxID=3346010 RepID=UPI003642B1BE